MVKKAKHFTDEMSVTELAELAGELMNWTPPRGPEDVTVRIMVLDVRLSYGRREALIVGEHGGGNGWVQCSTLHRLRRLAPLSTDRP